MLATAARSITLVAACALLGACSFNGTYQDSSRTDAAKLRYVSNTSNSTLDVYRGPRCEGSTTGLLNNFLARDTRRRADMRVPPTADTRGYLEIRLEPDQPLYLFVNTLSTGGAPCSIGVTFTPAAGSEYEVSVDRSDGYCMLQLTRLQRIDGKDVRIPYPLNDEPLASCSGTSPLFPLPPTPLAASVQRSAMIESLINDSLTSSGAVIDILQAGNLQQPPADQQIAERRKALGNATLPDAYWDQYRANLQHFEQALGQVKPLAQARFRDNNRKYLNSVQDQQLQIWAGLELGNRYNSREVRMRDMSRYYARVYRQITAEAKLEHLRAMAQLDRQYGVCERFEGCWRL
ncbi:MULTISPECIES: hypothetical protein [unclassified Pseudomonas]|uniref:hypothetical protein n=1 Tax=unclassified Pseudomonas TaxID=196821 RepID=UPI0006D3FA25|nr:MULTISPECIES: hypothetical protein [unclassified Pseudomonas]